MNIRVVILVLIIVVFALASGLLSYSVSDGIPLTEAYSNGNIKVVQETSAGTVPHEVMITNHGNTDIKIKKGDMLASTVSQNLVIAEDKKISPNSNETVKAYCLNPSKKAIVNTKLLPVNDTKNAVNKVISNSDPSDPQSALKAQLQIWIITTEDNLNPYSGEPVAVVENQNMTWSQFRQDIASAKNDVMTLFNVTEDQIPGLNQTQSNAGQSPSLIDNTINWIKGSLGIGS
jgi:hypothetical protein